MLRTTLVSTSRPTMSAVRNVADFGQPTAGPVHASTSSTVISSSVISRSTLRIENVPMRLAMKAGRSCAVRGEKCRGPRFLRGFEARAHDAVAHEGVIEREASAFLFCGQLAGNNVQQIAGHAGVGHVRGDARSHRAGTKDCYFLYASVHGGMSVLAGSRAVILRCKGSTGSYLNSSVFCVAPPSQQRFANRRRDAGAMNSPASEPLSACPGFP